MTNSPSPAPRIAPLPPDEWNDDVREILTADLGTSSPIGVTTLSELNIFRTVARHDQLFKPLLRFGNALLGRGALPFADRELLILRVARNTASEYEWGQHVKIAVEGGVERAKVDRVAAGPEADGWEERDRLLLRAADDLHAAAKIADATWTGLADHLEEHQLIELPLLVGYYTMLAYMLNSLAVAPEPGLESLPA